MVWFSRVALEKKLRKWSLDLINKDFFVKLEINLKLKDHDLAEELEKKIEVIFVLHMWSKEGNNPVDVSGLQLDGIEV